MAGRSAGAAGRRGDRGKPQSPPPYRDRHDRVPNYMLPDHPTNLIDERLAAVAGAVKPRSFQLGPRSGIPSRVPAGAATAGFLTGDPSVDDALRREAAVNDSTTFRLANGSGRAVAISSDTGALHVRTAVDSSLGARRSPLELETFGRYGNSLPDRGRYGHADLVDGVRRLSPDPQLRSKAMDFVGRPLSPEQQRRSRPLEFDGRRLSPGEPRSKTREYGIHEPSRKNLVVGEDRYISSEEEVLRRYRSRDDPRNLLSGSYFRDGVEDEWVNRKAIPPKVPKDSSFYDDVRRYDELEGGHRDYVDISGNRHREFPMELPHRRDRYRFEEQYDRDFARGVPPRRSISPYRHRYTYGDDMDPHGRDHDRDIYDDNIDLRNLDRRDEICHRLVNHQRGGYRDDISIEEPDYYEDMDIYDRTPERRSWRRNDADGDERSNAYDSSNRHRDSDTVFERIAYPDRVDEPWHRENRSRHFHPWHKSSTHHGARPSPYFQYRNTSRNEGAHNKSVKKRLGPMPPQYDDSERNSSIRPIKMSKFTRTDNMHGDDPERNQSPPKREPEEGSVEFDQEVHSAFLKFIKMFYESPTKQKIYRNPERGELSCCVCGSSSKYFSGTHDLVVHAYNKQVGSKTKHLGLHKALCLLLGWDWRVPPCTSKSYQSCSAEEMKALREDYILWPPIVVVHNSSIGAKAVPDKVKALTMEDVKGSLRGVGVELGKVKISYGKPANRSVFLVKLLPTVSGLQEAEQLHKHFAEKKHGRDELKQIKDSTRSSSDSNAEEILYGYIAIVEDLVHLDEETKKRSVIKSRKEIEAIIDAPLKMDT